jgi:hypothetical protein
MKLIKLNSNQVKKLIFLTNINRVVNPSHVTKMAQIITEYGDVYPILIARLSFLGIKNGLYVVDGQHRFHAMLRLGRVIYYSIVDTIKDKESLVRFISAVNAASKGWCMMDYVTAWKAVNKEYVKLANYFKTYDLELTTLATVLSGRTPSVGGGAVTKFIKMGDFKIVNEKENRQILDNITDVLTIIPRTSRSGDRALVCNYIQFYRGVIQTYNHQRFLKNLKKHKAQLLFATQDNDTLRKLFLTFI